MSTLTVSKAKAGFSGIVRRVIRTKRPVTVKTPAGYVQIAPFDAPEFVPAAEKGDFEYSEEAIRLANTIGEAP